MPNITPIWTDNVTVIAAQLVTGTVAAGTIDARAKHGAKVFVRIGRSVTDALHAGVTVLIRALINNGSPGGEHPGPVVPRTGTTTAAIQTTVDSDSASAQRDLNVASETSFAIGDYICIQDGDGGFTRLEFHRIAFIAAGLLTLDRNLGYAHSAANADTVTNMAECYPPAWIPGGSLYEIIIDASGCVHPIVAQVFAQTYDSELIA